MQSTEQIETVGFMESWNRKWQYFLDKTSPHVLKRWIAFTLAFFIYSLRVYLVNGWYIVTYGLGIFMLNQFIGFLSPQVYFLTFPPFASYITLIHTLVWSWREW